MVWIFGFGLLLSCNKSKPTETVAAKPAAVSQNQVAVLETTEGPITVELFAREAPVTVANFLNYAKSGFYTDTIVHRSVKGFVIQAGGYTAAMVEKPTQAPIRNEANNGLKNIRGTLSMARTQVVDSATSQFFISVADNAPLDHVPGNPSQFGYAVFGKVIEGMDVVDRINNADVQCPSRGPGPCDEKSLPEGMRDVPVKTVSIQRVVIKTIEEGK